MLLVAVLSWRIAAAKEWDVPNGGSIQAVYDGAANGDHLNLAGHGQYTVSLELGVTKTVTLVGNEATLVPALSGMPTVHVSAGTVHFEGLTLDAEAVAGSIVTRALVVSSGGAVNLQDTTVRGPRTSTLPDYGGAIRVEGGTVEVTDSFLTGGKSSLGGGVMAVFSGSVTITGTDLGEEGAVADLGGLFYVAGGSLQIEDSEILGGQATYGGGIAQTGGSVTLTNVTATGSGTWAAYGGILHLSGGMTTVSGGTFRPSAATVDGGFAYLTGSGLLDVTSADVGGGVVLGDGGIIYLDGVSTLSIADSDLHDTGAQTAAIYAPSTAMGSTITLESVSMYGNTTNNTASADHLDVRAAWGVSLSDSSFAGGARDDAVRIAADGPVTLSGLTFEPDAGRMSIEQAGTVTADNLLFCDAKGPMLSVTDAGEFALYSSAFLQGQYTDPSRDAALWIESVGAVTLENLSFLGVDSTVLGHVGTAVDADASDASAFVVQNNIFAHWNQSLLSGTFQATDNAEWEVDVPAFLDRTEDPRFVAYDPTIDLPDDACDFSTVRMYPLDEDGYLNDYIASGAEQPDGTKPDLGALGGPYLDPAWLDDVDNDDWQARYDCDDEDAARYPGAAEVCGEDANCDGEADGFADWYPDNDDDGWGDANGNALTVDCSSADPDGRSRQTGDCDDDDDESFPGGTEVCDGADNDCDQETDEDGTVTAWPDLDADGHGDANVPSESSSGCAVPEDYSLVGDDCDDSDPATVPSDDPETLCDGKDNNCTGDADEGLANVQYYSDGDGDGFGNSDVYVFLCPDVLPEEGYVTPNDDCDDDDSTSFPDGPELCDGKDNDCDEDVDDGITAARFVDADDDGYGTVVLVTVLGCDLSGTADNSDDCDDDDPTRSPDQNEDCNGIDDDCDDKRDDGLDRLIVAYTDADKDGYGGEEIGKVCALPPKATDVSGDCDDTDNDRYPGNPENAATCDDGIDQDCTGGDLACLASDADGDGWCGGAGCTNGSTKTGDCNDLNLAVHPYAAETCDDEDEDCDGLVDEGLTVDEDGDTFTAAGSCEGGANDCDDLRDDVNPDALEVCDGADNDCDHDIDTPVVDGDEDGVPGILGCFSLGTVDCDDTDPAVSPLASERLGNGIDDDCDGLKDESAPSPDADADLDGWTGAAGDCNDRDALVFPGAAERCNGLDDDCGGTVDWSEYDLDHDGFRGCEDDCDDHAWWNSPWLAEDCSDNLDNNCNGIVDEDADQDGDTWTTCEGDCRDGDFEIHPGATELCDNLDNDCDGMADESMDLDRDDYRDCDLCSVAPCDCNDRNAYVHPGAVDACDDDIDANCDGVLVDTNDADHDGHTVCEGDCDDDDAWRGPGNPERCDGVDNDCDRTADDGFDEDGDGFSTCGGDCDDTDDGRNVLAEETCNDRDDDCDLEIDEDTPDMDGDGLLPCTGDCDDEAPGVSRLQLEDCGDGIDNDCDALIDANDSECLGDTGEPTTDLDVREVPELRCAPASRGPMPWLLALALAFRRRRSSGTVGGAA